MKIRVNRLNDYLFKRIFGSEENSDILVAFLNAVLQPRTEESITSVDLIDRNLDPTFFTDKAARLDILARTRDGRLFNIEVQLLNPYEMERRTLYYWATLYQAQLAEGQHYRDLKPCIAINILGYLAFPDEPGCHHVFELRERSTARLLHDDLRIDFLEVPKFKGNAMGLPLALQRWMLYFAGTSGKTMEDVAMTEPMIKKAITCEEIFLKDQTERRLYFLREKARLDELSLKEGAWREGHRKGMEEGMQEGTRQKALEIARQLLDLLDVATIADKTGLSREEVEKLRLG